jgi:hypothetical protein
MDKELEVNEVVLQIREVSDPQLPLYNWISEFEKFVPKLLIATVCVPWLAMNLYQTS